MPVRASEREGRRASLSLRTTNDLRSQLEDAASKAGRSLAQEIERRLERSLHGDDVLASLFGSQHGHAQTVVRAIAGALQHVEGSTGHRFVDDEETLRHCRSAATSVVALLLNGDDAPLVQRASPSEDITDLGQEAAARALRDLGLLLPHKMGR